MTRPSPALAAVLLPLALLGGCAVGPDFQRPAPPVAAGYTPAPLADAQAGGVTQTFALGQDVPGRWWSLYQSPALDRLVERALKANADLEAAQAALRAARETLIAQRGALLPTVDAGYTAVPQQVSAVLAPPLNSNADIFTLHTAQVTVGYTPDIFGGVRRQTETVAAQAENQRYQTEAAYLTLTANLVAAAIQEASLRDQVAATQKIIAVETEILDLMRRQMAAGQIGGGDVASQEALLAQAETALPPLLKQLAQSRDQLAALSGGLPSEAQDDGIELSSLVLPSNLPVSLPSSLVRQRPDVLAAEANLHAASAQVGVAVAARLPAFSLTANAGGMATHFADLFSHGDGFWTITAGVTQPIFEGGALLHRQRAAEASLDQAKAQYRSAVIDAFQNVADSLQALQADAAALQAADHAVASAKTSLDIARKQLEVGETSRLTVLSAEQAYQQGLIGQVQARASRYADTAALFQALGGGWWNRSETTAKSAS